MCCWWTEKQKCQESLVWNHGANFSVLCVSHPLSLSVRTVGLTLTLLLLLVSFPQYNWLFPCFSRSSIVCLFVFFVGFLQVLIIDEVSMIGGELLEKLDNVAQLVKNKQQPFGGLSLTLFPFPPSFALSFSRLRLFSNSISPAHALTHANTHTQ